MTWFASAPVVGENNAAYAFRISSFGVELITLAQSKPLFVAVPPPDVPSSATLPSSSNRQPVAVVTAGDPDVGQPELLTAKLALGKSMNTAANPSIVSSPTAR